MNEQVVRDLVRDAVARHLGGRDRSRPLLDPSSAGSDASHARYLHLVNGTDACLIEPAVPCNHCGYCESHGH